MNKFKYFILCLILLLVTGCGYEPKLLKGKELVAEIEGNKITVDSLYEEMKNKFARDILIDMINTSILNKEYPIDDEMNANADSQVQNYKMQYGEQFLSVIKYYGANNEAEFRAMIMTTIQQSKAIDAYIKTLITDKEINKYYEDEIVGDIKASHILIKPDVTDEMTSEEKTTKEKEALDLAKDIIKKLNTGEKFADLAKEYSNDKSSADNGGDLSYFNKGQMTQVFEEAVYKLEKGKYSTTPVKTEYGYHIILKTDQKAKPELKTVKSTIMDALVEKKKASDPTLREKALIELRKEYKLEIYDTELKKQYDDYMEKALDPDSYKQ